MKKLIVDSFVVGLALFAMFFGAGNIIFPPSLGLTAGESWLTSFFFYYMADVGLALIAIFAMLRTQHIDKVEGIMHRLGNIPSKAYMAIAVFCIGPLLAVPRTAVISYEMAVVPFVGNGYLNVFIISYFLVCYLFAIKESKLVDIVGKFLTPALVIGLFVMIFKGIIDPIGSVDTPARMDAFVWSSIRDGYQTLDVLAALVYGLIVINALKARGYTSHREKFISVGLASIIAGSILFIIYAGLCYLGATVSTLYPVDINKASLVIKIAEHLLGNIGSVILGLIVLLACITTAVALIGSTGTFFSTLSHGKLSYNMLVTLTCLFSIIVANFGLDVIIAISVPILMVIYPGALVVVVLSLFNNMISNDNIFKAATLGAVLVSTCEMLNGFNFPFGFVKLLPFEFYGLGWVVPAIVFGVVGSFIPSKNKVSA